MKPDALADSATAPARSEIGGSGSAWSVGLERTVCFGNCPAYAVKVELDGTVTFRGTAGVADTTEHVQHVAPASVRALQAQIAAAGFSQLPAKFANGEPTCPLWHTNAPTATITVQDGKQSHAVVHDHGCADVPKILATLEQAIDSVAQTSNFFKVKPIDRQ